MSADTVTIETGGCTITVSIEANLLTVDRLVLDKVHDFIDALQAIAGATKDEPAPVVPVHLPDAAPVVLPKAAPKPERQAAIGDPWQCPECGTSIKDPSNVRRHITRCGNVKPRRHGLLRPADPNCVHGCGRTFDHAPAKGMHEKHCTGVARPASVVVPDSMEPARAPVIPPALSLVEAAGAVDPPPLVCEHCGENFTRPQTLARHERSCRDELDRAAARPVYKCDTCGKTFADKGALSRHDFVGCTTHDGTPVNKRNAALVCTTCDKRFELHEAVALARHTMAEHNRRVTQTERQPRAAAS